jgi:hypothetical protein
MVKEVREANPKSQTQFLFGTARHTANVLVRERVWLAHERAKLANDVEAIPPAETLDRVLRAEVAADTMAAATLTGLFFLLNRGGWRACILARLFRVDNDPRWDPALPFS